MVSGNNADQYNDTTFTKLFVGGLAWETHRDTMSKYFEQFGEILEAAVTFKDPVAAMRACQNPSPVIDGRRANCNLASLGANNNKPPPSQHGAGRFRRPPAYHGSSSTFFHQPIGQYTFPYSTYGYSGYSQDTLYPTDYYGIYGGQHFSPYYPSGAVGLVQNMYPYYVQYAHTNQAHGFGVQYPQMAQLPILPQHHYGSIGILSCPSSISLPTIASAVSATTTTSTTTTISACVATTSKVSEQNSTSQG
ncbi:unnamed protein product [Lupinus luteus]|uniref:RRM domain-containing protein n=1 Tax=Lupinus luteus TaxID=3873 RepID=A0AAV1WF12_LUPLU